MNCWKAWFSMNYIVKSWFQDKNLALMLSWIGIKPRTIYSTISFLKRKIWTWNLINNQRMFNVGIDDFHTSCTKVYFNEFVANALRDNMGIIIFDLWSYGGCWRPKTYLCAHFGALTQRSVHPTAPFLLTKDSPRHEISYDSQPPFSLHISNSITEPTGLDF